MWFIILVITSSSRSQSVACNMKKPVDAISGSTCRVEYMHKVLEQLPDQARAEAARRCATTSTCSKLLEPAVHDIGLAYKKSGCSSTAIDMDDLVKCKRPPAETFRDCVRKIKSADDDLDSKKCVPRSSALNTDLVISVSVLYRPGNNRGSNFL